MIPWVSKVLQNYQQEGLSSTLKKVNRYSTRRISSKYLHLLDNIVTPIRSRYLFDHDWDLAIILDGCRYDLGKERGSDHQIGLGEPTKVHSTGCVTVEWLDRTFGNASADILAETAYVSGNPHMRIIPQKQLAHLEKVYRYAWDPELGTVPPRPITDQSIELMRDNVAERYLVHYMQPHLPPLNPSKKYKYRWDPTEAPVRELTEPHDPWESARSGHYPETVIHDYRHNIDPVLDEVELLLKNVDARKVVITSDHGQYLGERGRWGHEGRHHIHSAVRHVPWWETQATNEATHTPSSYDKTPIVKRKEQLRALGYL